MEYFCDNWNRKSLKVKLGHHCTSSTDSNSGKIYRSLFLLLIRCVPDYTLIIFTKQLYLHEEKGK